LSAGEPFYVWLLLKNESEAALRVAPVYFLSRDYLEFDIQGDDGRLIKPTYGAADISSRIETDDFELVPPGGITGQEVLFSPLLPEGMDYIYGLTPGCYDFEATIHLHSFESRIIWEQGPRPVAGTFTSQKRHVCIAKPRPETIVTFRALLSSADFEEVIEALNYFANVQDEEAALKIRELAGDPRGWLARFPSPFHILAALRVQPDSAANLPYFKEALGTRYEDFAREGIQMIKERG
jgi:hypothetical protein